MFHMLLEIGSLPIPTKHGVFIRMDLSPYCKGGSVIPVNLDKLKSVERIYDPRRFGIQILGIRFQDLWVLADVGWRLIVLENTMARQSLYCRRLQKYSAAIEHFGGRRNPAIHFG